MTAMSGTDGRSATPASRRPLRKGESRRRVPFEKLAALGAVGVSFGVLALYALIVFITMPRRTGGIDTTNAQLTWISVGVVVLTVIAIHLVFARVLWRAPGASR